MSVAHTARATHAPSSASHTARGADRAEALKRFGAEIEAIRREVEAKLGAEDVRYVKKVDAFSRAMEVLGRVLIHVSPEPITFLTGVTALWLHKQLQATEVGHTALHGAFDGLPGAERFQSKGFRWDVPIDEESWDEGHNRRHHPYTNIAGKDPDIHFGPVRLTEHTPFRAHHRAQLPFTVFFLWPNFGFLMNLHFTGLNDFYFGNDRADGMDFLPDRSWKTALTAHRRALRKYLPHYLKEYAFFPLLAGPFFWKVMLGNWLAATARDVYSAVTIYCGHVGEDVASYPDGTRPRGQGAWYAMQVESANNFEVPLPISMLCGALDLQIEHHLFPRFPTNRLREIAPKVRAACERHGIRYKTDTWGRTLAKALRQIARLSHPDRAAQPFAAADVALGAA
ncbi:MAG: fatty acid desaturase [bacterium]